MQPPIPSPIKVCCIFWRPFCSLFFFWLPLSVILCEAFVCLRDFFVLSLTLGFIYFLNFFFFYPAAPVIKHYINISIGYVEYTALCSDGASHPVSETKWSDRVLLSHRVLFIFINEYHTWLRERCGRWGSWPLHQLVTGSLVFIDEIQCFLWMAEQRSA